MPDASEGREGNQIPNCSLHRKPVQSQLTVCDTVHYIHNYDYMPRGRMGGWVGGGGLRMPIRVLFSSFSSTVERLIRCHCTDGPIAQTCSKTASQGKKKSVKKLNKSEQQQQQTET